MREDDILSLDLCDQDIKLFSGSKRDMANGRVKKIVKTFNIGTSGKRFKLVLFVVSNATIRAFLKLMIYYKRLYEEMGRENKDVFFFSNSLRYFASLYHDNNDDPSVLTQLRSLGCFFMYAVNACSGKHEREANGGRKKAIYVL